MATRTATLIARLVDDVSGPAKGMAKALQMAEAQAKALSKAQDAGASGKFAAGLRGIGAQAKEIEKVTEAWQKYARSVGAGADKASWTKGQTSQIRQWESSTVAALKSVQRAQDATAASARDLASAQLKATVKAGQAARVARERESAAAAEAQAARAQTRSESRRLLLSGAGIYAGHKVKEGTAASLHTYREFDKYSRQTEAFGNFSKAEMAQIIAMSIHGDKSTRFNDIQYLQGAKALGGRGVKASSVMGILPEAGYYGQAMGVDLPEAVAGLEGSLFGFQRDLSTAEKASAAARRTADLQVGAAKAFGLTHHDLKGGYEYGALGASMTGLSEEKLLAFLGLGKKLNIEGSAQGNAWRAMTGKFLSPTRKGREALAGVGIDYSKYQQMPERLSVDNFSSMIAQQYGAKLDKGARAKLEKAFTDKKTFGDASAFAVAVKDAVKGQVGVTDAKSANKVLGSAERFRQNNVSKVDVNALFDALLEKVRGGNLALANAIFGEKQGTRIMAALRDDDTWRKSVEKVEHTPEGKAREVSDKMSGGFEGASSRWEKALKNLETAFGRSWDAGGEGGFLTGVTDAAAKTVQALADMDAKVLQVASGLAWLGGKLVEGAGTLGLLGSALALTKSAAELSAAAALLAGKPSLPGADKPGTKAVIGGALTGTVLGAGAAGGAYLDWNFGGNPGAVGLVTGQESDHQKSMRYVREREAGKAAAASLGYGGPRGPAKVLPPGVGGGGSKAGYASDYTISRGGVGDFLWGREKKSQELPGFGSAAPKVDTSQIEGVKPKAEEAKTSLDTLSGTFTPIVPPDQIVAALGHARAER